MRIIMIVFILYPGIKVSIKIRLRLGLIQGGRCLLLAYLRVNGKVINTRICRRSIFRILYVL